jgi:cytochrome c
MRGRQKKLACCLAVSLSFSLSNLCNVALAQTAPAAPTELIDQQHCMFCHTMDTPYYGPSFKQIAEHYRGVPGAEAMLEEKLRLAGAAHWGVISMPLAVERGGPLSPQEARRLVEWVLSQ